MGQLLSITPHGRRHPQITVIIPTYNEASTIGHTLSALRARTSGSVHVIVSDAHSTDATASIARRHGARVLRVSGGRALQQNVAARHSKSPYILFLHADTIVPSGYDADIARVLATPGVRAGAFRLSFDESSLPNDLQKRLIRCVAAAANWRSHVLQSPYGDQGFFFSRQTFEEIGGFPNMPFLEDYEMTRRVVRTQRENHSDAASGKHGNQGGRKVRPFALANSAVATSARRYETLGIFRTTVMNQAVVTAYHLGVPVPTLQRWYRRTLIRARNHKELRGTLCTTPQCP